MVSMYVWEVNAREVKKGSGIVWEAIQNRGGFRHTHCLRCGGASEETLRVYRDREKTKSWAIVY